MTQTKTSLFFWRPSRWLVLPAVSASLYRLSIFWLSSSHPSLLLSHVFALSFLHLFVLFPFVLTLAPGLCLTCFSFHLKFKVNDRENAAFKTFMRHEVTLNWTETNQSHTTIFIHYSFFSVCICHPFFHLAFCSSFFYLSFNYFISMLLFFCVLVTHFNVSFKSEAGTPLNYIIHPFIPASVHLRLPLSIFTGKTLHNSQSSYFLLSYEKHQLQYEKHCT